MPSTTTRVSRLQSDGRAARLDRGGHGCGGQASEGGQEAVQTCGQAKNRLPTPEGMGEIKLVPSARRAGTARSDSHNLKAHPKN